MGQGSVDWSVVGYPGGSECMEIYLWEIVYVGLIKVVYGEF